MLDLKTCARYFCVFELGEKIDRTLYKYSLHCVVYYICRSGIMKLIFMRNAQAKAGLDDGKLQTSKDFPIACNQVCNQTPTKFGPPIQTLKT